VVRDQKPQGAYQYYPGCEQCLAESGIKEGLLLCNAMHITSSVFINDDESGLHHDFEVWLEKLAPNIPIHNTGITDMKIMPTPILKGPSWAGRWWLP
jgi:thiamine phosphate synthase YjbQ (UPF0047 family)